MISKIHAVILGFAVGQSITTNPTKDDCLQNEWGSKKDGFDEEFLAFAETCAQVLFDSNQAVPEGNTSMEFVSHVSDGEGIKGDHGQPLTGPNVSDKDKCLFVGHLAPDCDAIGGAYVGAKLYNGLATRSQYDSYTQLNGEIQFQIAFAGIDGEKDLPKFDNQDDDTGGDHKVIMVDHNANKQRTYRLQVQDPQTAPNAPLTRKEFQDRVRGLIDHHNITGDFADAIGSPKVHPGKLPEEMNIMKGMFQAKVEPWGSMCAVHSYNFLNSKVKMDEKAARMALVAMMSDTLGLTSTTTTAMDHIIGRALFKIGKVNTIDRVYLQDLTPFTEDDDYFKFPRKYESLEVMTRDQFNYKGWKYVNMSAKEKINTDAKVFTFHDSTNRPINTKIGVLELPSKELVEQLLSKTSADGESHIEEIKAAMRQEKADPNINIELFFFFVVSVDSRHENAQVSYPIILDGESDQEIDIVSQAKVSKEGLKAEFLWSDYVPIKNKKVVYPQSHIGFQLPIYSRKRGFQPNLEAATKKIQVKQQRKATQNDTLELDSFDVYESEKSWNPEEKYDSEEENHVDQVETTIHI